MKTLYAFSGPKEYSVVTEIKDQRMNVIKSRSVVKAAERVTVALSYDPGTDNYFYGIAICAPGDQFCKDQGKKLAKNKMNEGFGVVRGERVRNMPVTIKDKRPEMQQPLFLLSQLLSAVEKNPDKFKQRLCKHRKQNPQAGK